MSIKEFFLIYPSLYREYRKFLRVAKSSAPVLIIGEAGTGKSRLAHAIHSESKREGELVVLDCGAVPRELFEAEMFGYVKGAFTGAVTSRVGKIKRSDKGSLVIDHIELLPLELQPKLLRVIGEHEFTPLGGELQKVDTRFIVTSDPEIYNMVKKGLFRKDLFFRINVFTIKLPPLRDNVGNLEKIVELVLKDTASRLSLERVPVVDKATIEWMKRYDWPGNLRELQNMLERELVYSESDILSVPPPKGNPVKPRPLAEVEKIEILKALAYTGGHQEEAARLLGISRKTLWKKRKLYGIP